MDAKSSTNGSLKRKLPNGRYVILTTSWDDFRDEDAALIPLLRKYDIPGTFYIPYNQILSPAKRKLAKACAKDFAIGGHTINHQILTDCDMETAVAEVAGCRLMLEDALHVQVRKFCYPRGRHNAEIRAIVRDAGFTSARTTKVLWTGYDRDPFETDTTIHVYQRKEYEGRPWLKIAVEIFDRIVTAGGYFHLWGHSYEIERDREWANLEWFLSYIQQRMYKL